MINITPKLKSETGDRILKNCLEVIANESFTEMNSFFELIMKSFKSKFKQYISRELYILDSAKSKAVRSAKDQYSSRYTDRNKITFQLDLAMRKTGSTEGINKSLKIIQFEMIKMYYSYGYRVHAEKSLKKMVIDYPQDSDVWFELFLFYQSLQDSMLASQSLNNSLKLHFAEFEFEYQMGDSFLTNLAKFLYFITLKVSRVEGREKASKKAQTGVPNRRYSFKPVNQNER